MQKEHALDTLLVLLFGALMARGIIDALGFFNTVILSIKIIVLVWYRSWFKERISVVRWQRHQHLAQSTP